MIATPPASKELGAMLARHKAEREELARTHRAAEVDAFKAEVERLKPFRPFTPTEPGFYLAKTYCWGERFQVVELREWRFAADVEFFAWAKYEILSHIPGLEAK